jgi:hypothetical protein
VDPVPDPLLLRKSGSAGNRTRDLWICSQELWTEKLTSAFQRNSAKSLYFVSKTGQKLDIPHRTEHAFWSITTQASQLPLKKSGALPTSEEEDQVINLNFIFYFL